MKATKEILGQKDKNTERQKNNSELRRLPGQFYSNELRGTNMNYDELLQIKLDTKGGWAGGDAVSSISLHLFDDLLI